MKELNNVVKLRGKIRGLQLSTKLLKECIFKRVSSKFIAKRIEKSKIRHNSTVERAFLNDKICKNQSKLVKLYRKLQEIRPKASQFLSFFDWARFSRYLANVEQTQRDLIKAKHFRNLNWMIKQRFGSVPSYFDDNICNLSSYKLSNIGRFVLAYGLDFCLPPSDIKREKIFAEFKVLIGQLLHHTSKSKESRSALKAKLTDLAHSFCGTPIDITTNFTMHRECFHAIKSLCNNSDIIITKADKSNAVVNLDKSDYFTKMNVTLNSQKLQKISHVNENDNTARIEGSIQRRLLAWTKENMLAKSVYEHIRPSGSQRPRMYGLPKTHKKDVPLRPILSMVGLAQH